PLAANHTSDVPGGPPTICRGVAGFRVAAACASLREYARRKLRATISGGHVDTASARYACVDAGSRSALRSAGSLSHPQEFPVPTLDEARSQVALANRILAHEGVLDAFGHVSMRHPSDPSRYLLARSRSP